MRLLWQQPHKTGAKPGALVAPGFAFLAVWVLGVSSLRVFTRPGGPDFT